MKRNRILIILAIILGTALFFVNKSYTTLDDKESGFAVADTSTVTKIFMDLEN